MEYAVAYARYSSDMQSSQSIESQFREIDEWAKRNGVQIVYRESDEARSAYHDSEDRTGFWRLIEQAKRDPRITLFVVISPDRFMRNTYQAGAVKADLAKHHIRVVATGWAFDPRTVEGTYMEALGDAGAQAYSLAVSKHTHRGQKQNIQTRDPETGWCYRNGGRPLYGYRNVRLSRGSDPRGKEIVKTIWLLDEETSKVARWILLDCKLQHDMTARQICRALNSTDNPWNRPIPSPSGGTWTKAGVCSLFRQDHLETYTGVATWNKEYGQKDRFKPRGVKFKPPEEVIKIANAHPALITEDECAKIITALAANPFSGSKPRTRYSRWLLSGENLFGEPMMLCRACGGAFRSYENYGHERHRAKYACNTYASKMGCMRFLVDREWVETVVLAEIDKLYQTPEMLTQLVEAANSELRQEQEKAETQIKSQQQRRREIEAKISNIVSAIEIGNSSKVLLDRLAALENEMELLKSEEQITATILPEIHPEDIIALVNEQKTLITGAPNDEERNAALRNYVRSFIRQIQVDPVASTLTINCMSGQILSCKIAKISWRRGRDANCCELRSIILIPPPRAFDRHRVVGTIKAASQRVTPSSHGEC